MIAPEGKIILSPLFFIILLVVFIYVWIPLGLLKFINIILATLFMFSIYFFRDPKRALPLKEGFISPADGKIVQIIDVKDPEIGIAKQISIFLSVFNVHCQRVPLAAKVISKAYNKGKFLAAFNHKASIDNEQAIVMFQTKAGEKYKIKQIAGLVARRILNYMEPGIIVERGQRLGFIRFGSRVDIIVPKDFQINVKLGDIVKGNISIIGNFNEN